MRRKEENTVFFVLFCCFATMLIWKCDFKSKIWLQKIVQFQYCVHNFPFSPKKTRSAGPLSNVSKSIPEKTILNKTETIRIRLLTGNVTLDGNEVYVIVRSWRANKKKHSDCWQRFGERLRPWMNPDVNAHSFTFTNTRKGLPFSRIRT